MSPNGCGPAWFDNYRPTAWLKKVLFNWFHEASCNMHDIGYQEGGDELWRWYCDARFFLAMLRDVRKQSLMLMPVAFVLANAFYITVVLLGWTRFTYK